MKKLDVVILNGDIKFPKTDRWNLLYENQRSWRHANGEDNYNYGGVSTLEQLNNFSEYLDEDTLTGDLIFPTSNTANDTMIKELNRYYSIFERDIRVGSTVSASFNDTKYILPLLDKDLLNPLSAKFQNLENKFRPFKRWIWYTYKRYQGDYPIAFALDRFLQAEVIEGLCFVFDTSQDSAVSHEIGHLYGLEHWGDSRDSIELKKKNNSYYGMKTTSNPKWSPIMGVCRFSDANIQWSNGNYLPSWSYDQDDIKVLEKRVSLIKPPINKVSKYVNNIRDLDKARKMARIFNVDNFAKSNGMIGFPYDYDIIKIIVPAGDTQITVRPADLNNRSSDIDADILYCDCELDKQKANINMSATFDTYWAPEDETKILRKIAINNSDKYVQHELHDDKSRTTISFNINSEYTSLIYLRVRGDFISPVDTKEEKPTEVDKGQDRYGSLGQYKVGAFSDNEVFNTDIPNAHCEDFYACVNGQFQKITLFVQDEKDEQINGTEGGVHIYEGSALIDGELKTKRFLVIGYPLSIDQEGLPGKFYLPVIKDGVCMKYAFIVGHSTTASA